MDKIMLSTIEDCEDLLVGSTWLTGGGGGSFKEALAAIYDKYRSPRTPYSFIGSSKDGQRIAKAVADQTGGGW